MRTYSSVRKSLTVEPSEDNVSFKDTAVLWGTLAGIFVQHKTYAIISIQKAISSVILAKICFSISNKPL